MNGPNTAPVYEFLKKNAGGLLGDFIKWNFEKFLVDKNGVVVQRYAPTTSPYQIEVNKFLLWFYNKTIDRRCWNAVTAPFSEHLSYRIAS